VLFFTFIEPKSMAVPPAFAHLAGTRGMGINGSVPAETIIIFSVGGAAYRYDEYAIVQGSPWS
jgi:hypothetical protein